MRIIAYKLKNITFLNRLRIFKLTFIILLSSFTILFGCGKRGVRNKYILTDQMKNQNPYNGGEKIYFITDSLDYLIFEAHERDNQVHEVPFSNDVSTYDLYEVERTYLTIDNNNNFLLDMHNNGGFKYFIDLSYNNLGRRFRFDLPLTKENNQYIDSMNIGEHWYYNIFISEKDTLKNNAYKLFYSTEFGIIRIEFSDGSNWNLEKVVW